MSGFKRLSLAACAILLTLSSTAEAQDLSSGYTLTRVDEKGENTITKFEWNSELNKMVPVYYRVDLAQKEYGSGKDVKYFEWADYGAFEEIFNPTEGKTTITAGYDASNLHEPVVSNSYLADVTGDFVENSAGEEGAAIYNSGFIENITGNFVANKSQFSGGAIYNSGKISEISGNFIGNRVEDSYSAAGGAIFNTNPPPARASEGSEVEYSETSFNISGNFIGNSAVALSEAELPPKPLALYNLSTTTGMGGAIVNGAYIGNITGSFIGNYASGEYAEATGGAIDNYSGEIKNITGNFIGNNVQSEGFAAGGAIMTFTDLNIVAKDGYTSVFSGNYTEVNGERDDNAIYAGYGSTINFEMKNGGKFVMADNIRGVTINPNAASLQDRFLPSEYNVKDRKSVV